MSPFLDIFHHSTFYLLGPFILPSASGKTLIRCLWLVDEVSGTITGAIGEAVEDQLHSRRELYHASILHQHEERGRYPLP
ncbi:hypothetical protein J437_LFUL012099, partial [Ladona fulva]